MSSVRDLRAQTAIIEAADVGNMGLHIERDLELPTKRAIMQECDRVDLVVISSKMNRSGLGRRSGFDAIDVLVTDAPLPSEIAEEVSRQRVDV